MSRIVGMTSTELTLFAADSAAGNRSAGAHQFALAGNNLQIALRGIKRFASGVQI